MVNQINFNLTETQMRFMQNVDPAISFISGIGGGKSFILTLWALLQAAKGRTVLYILPSYPMVRDIAFPTIRDHIHNLGIEDKCKLNESSATLSIGNGTIMFRSAETKDRIRGINCHDLCFDEAGFIDKSFYQLALGRKRMSEDGMIRAVGTPTGPTWFTLFDVVYTQSTFANPFLPVSYKMQLAAEYTGDFARQELYGEILNSDSPNQMFPSSIVNEAMERIPIVNDSDQLIAGLDVARFGGDKSVLLIRRGNKIESVHKWGKNTTIGLAEEVAELLLNTDVKQLVIDAVGVGAGVYDMLDNTLGSVIKVYEYNSGFKPSRPKFINLRMETAWEMKKWLENGGSLKGIDESIPEQLKQIRYSFMNKGKMLLESKDSMKRRGYHSPDEMDALAMTFWNGIRTTTETQNQSKYKYISKYSTARNGMAR